MLNICVQPVVRLGKKLVKGLDLYALSTNKKILGALFINLCAYFAQVLRNFCALFLINFYSLPYLNFRRLYPLSTGPINTTN